MQIRNPVFNAQGTIDCEIEHPVYGWIPFTASPNDSEAHGREIYADAQAGKFGPIGAYIPNSPEVSDLYLWRQTAVLTRIEMAYALLVAGILTQSDAEVFAAHGLPQPLATMIESLPTEAQPLARLKMFGAKEFPRKEPEWDMLAASEGWPSEADIDAIFGWVEPQ